MKLAICIPIYNFDVRPLVQALYKQTEALSQEVEIIMIDDASDSSYKDINKAIKAWGTYIELPQNIGRAKIRNLFLQHSQADYFLFLDGDALIIKNDFLSKYLQLITKQQPPIIICGGRVYPTHLASPSQSLRWRYGHAKESQTADIRNQHPNRSFMTNNFVVKREVLANIPFEERLSQYGHEDTLFGFELQKQGISIMHINNPILNGDIETNAVFMAKTEAGIKSLAQIIRWQQQDKNLINSIQLSRTYFILPSWLTTIYKFLFNTCLRKPLRWLLLHKHPPLLLFNLYKLGYFATVWQAK